jgi:hypothetical protein
VRAGCIRKGAVAFQCWIGSHRHVVSAWKILQRHACAVALINSRASRKPDPSFQFARPRLTHVVAASRSGHAECWSESAHVSNAGRATCRGALSVRRAPKTGPLSNASCRLGATR